MKQHSVVGKVLPGIDLTAFLPLVADGLEAGRARAGDDDAAATVLVRSAGHLTAG